MSAHRVEDRLLLFRLARDPASMRDGSVEAKFYPATYRYIMHAQNAMITAWHNESVVNAKAQHIEDLENPRLTVAYKDSVKRQMQIEAAQEQNERNGSPSAFRPERTEWVNGYYRSDGTYVNGYWRAP